MKNDVLLLFAAVVTALVSLIGVAFIESSIGLHTLVRAGDIDLGLLSVVVGFSLTYFVMKFAGRAYVPQEVIVTVPVS